MTTMKKICPYGERCYRKNPDHFQEYSHSSSSEPIDELSSKEAQVKESELQVISENCLYIELIRCLLIY